MTKEMWEPHLAFGEYLDADRLRRYLASHRLDHERRLRDYLETEAAGGPDRFQRATLSFGIHYERAVPAWMDELDELLG